MTNNSRHGGCIVSMVKIVIGAVLLIAIIGAIVSTTKSGPPSPERLTELNKQDELKSAYYAARGYIEKSLKAPSTAKWSPYYPSKGTGAEIIENTTNCYYAIGSVDADNSFGAKIRKSWRVEMIHDGDMWRFYKATLGDDVILDLAPPSR